MTVFAGLLESTAIALEYPREKTAAELTARLPLGGESAAQRGLEEALGALTDWLKTVDLGAAEERYTQLFDLKPVCTLHVGYQLFGDNYVRGELLAGLAGELREAGIEYGHDIPDFLPILLRFIARAPQDDDLATLVHVIVRPGLQKISEALAESEGAYPPLLSALAELLDETIEKPAELADLIKETPPTLPIYKEAFPCSM